MSYNYNPDSHWAVVPQPISKSLNRRFEEIEMAYNDNPKSTIILSDFFSKDSVALSKGLFGHYKELNKKGFNEDTCTECGQTVKDSGPSHCNSCGQGPFCMQHLQKHLVNRANGCLQVRGC